MKQHLLKRTWNYFMAAVIIAGTGCNNVPDKNENKNGALTGKISISGAFALYPLAVEWTTEFKKLHPGVTFDIQAGGAGKGMADALTATVDIGMVSRAINEQETAKGAFPVAVAKDAVIPTINENNPWLNELNAKGATAEQFKGLWIEGKITTWGQLLTNNVKNKIEVYTRSDAAGAPETWAKFLGGEQEDLLGVGVFGDPGVAEAVTRNKYAIGFNNINYVYDIRTKQPYPGLRALKIDLNGNGKIDDDENFYSSLDQLNAAIVNGKFPSPPARELFFVTKNKPVNHLVTKFLKWVLTEGQAYVMPTGYVKLDDEILKNESAKLD